MTLADPDTRFFFGGGGGEKGKSPNFRDTNSAKSSNCFRRALAIGRETVAPDQCFACYRRTDVKFRENFYKLIIVADDGQIFIHCYF